jgi:hypothetical protein
MAWIGTIALAAAAHIFLRDAAFSLVPFTFLLSILIAFLLPEPFIPLIILALAAELLSATVPGLQIATVGIPWLMRWLFRKVDIELSFSLLGVVLLTVSLQTTVAFLPELWNGPMLSHIIPWKLATLIMFLTTLAAYSILLVWHEYSPAYD